jgi:hypothetical protein
MRILGSIVQIPACPMPDLREDRSLSDAIAAQAISDEASRFVFRPMQQAFEEALCGRAVPTVLHQDVQHDAMLINCAPQIATRPECG